MFLFDNLLTSLRRTLGKKKKLAKQKPAARFRLEVEALERRELPATGLVAAYNFNQSSGTFLNDVSGNGNNGTVVNATWSTKAHSSRSLLFDGTSAVVNIANAPALQLTAGMTLEAWVYPTSVTSAPRDVLAKGNNYVLDATTTNNKFPSAGGNIGGADVATFGVKALTANRWSHLTETYDGSTLKLYVNGVLVSSKAQTGNILTSSNPLQIGGSSAGDFFKGYIDDVRIYNVALTAAQVKTDMNTAVAATTPLTASAGAAKSGNQGNGILFNGTAAGGRGTKSYTWNFGDGTSATGTLSPTHNYVNYGSYTVTLTVTDTTASWAQSSTAATIVNIAPAVTVGGPYSGTTGTAISFTGNATDPSPQETAALTYAWNFGDGGTSNVKNPTHAYASAGTYNVSLTVTDMGGLTKTAATTAAVTAPTVTSVFPNTANPPPLPAPSSTIINVSTVAELQSAVANLQSNQTIVIAPGTYNLSQGLYIGLNGQVTNVGIRGATNNPGDVKLVGQGMDNSAGAGVGISIWNAQNFTVANLSISQVYYHAIELKGEAGADNITVYNCTLIDCGEQLIKGTPNSTGGGVDNGIVQYCTIGYTTAPSTVDHGGGTGYTQGVDIHGATGWLVSNNFFKNFHTPDNSANLWNPTVLFWNHSANNSVVGNTFINCDRAIGFGLIDQASGFDNQGGLIANNFVYMSPGLYSAGRIAGADAPIIAWDSPGTVIAFNTIITNGNTPNSIQTRFASTTGVTIKNNLADGSLLARDGSVYSASGNYLTATASMFLNPAVGDLHLISNSATIANVIGKASAVTGVTKDYDGQSRNAATDIGADQYTGSSQDSPVATVNPVNINYGTALANAQLSGTATATVNGVPTTVAGTFTYTTAVGTLLSAGNSQSQQVTFTPTNTAAYATVVTTVLVNVAKATPVLTVNAVNITFGTALSNGQLTGTAKWTVGGVQTTVAGTFTYTTGVGTVLAVGNGQTQPVTFTPTNAANFNAAAGTVTINVAAAADITAPTISLTAPAGGATVSGTSVALSANAADNVGVVGVQFYVDGSPVGAEDTTNPYGATWNTTTTANGSHSVTARARDAAGNMTTSSALQVTVGNVVSSTGLVAAYNFEQGSGSILTDSSGNLLNGIINGAAWNTSGKFGKALFFNGVSNWVTVSDNSLIDLTAGMTLEAWVKPTAAGTTYSTVLMKEGSGALAYALYANDNAGLPPSSYINMGPGDQGTAGTAVLPVNAWSHLASTYDGSMLRMYVDGVQVGTKQLSGNIMGTNGSLRIGGNSVWPEYFKGYIDEVRVYSRALSATEIQSDMNAPVSPPAPDTTPPTVAAAAPTPGATGVSATSTPVVIFSEFMNATTVTNANVKMKNSAGTWLTCSVNYNSNNKSVTIVPAAALANSTTYTVAVIGGANGVADQAGNKMATDFQASFTTAAATPPSANAGANQSGIVGSPIGFNGSAGGGSGALTYAWTFGDGGTASGTLSPSHAYNSAGTFNVTLTVTDGTGLSATSSVTATVAAAGSINPTLLHQNNLQYLGAFKVPLAASGVSNFGYGGTAMAFNPANNSLFMVGHPYDQAIAEVTIPSLVNSTSLSALNTASYLQPFSPLLSRLPSNPISSLGTVNIGGLQVVNGKLIGTAYVYYDGNGTASASHFTLSSTNLASASVGGLYQVGNQGAGLVAGYMTPIPSEWQNQLGAPYITAQSDIPIISRTSSGPAAFGFNPATLGSGSTPATPYLYYPATNPLGPYEGAVDPLQNASSGVLGAVFPSGTSSVIYLGHTGFNYEGYGEASDYGDPYNTYKGPHTLNGQYTFQAWAYNANDLLAVKQGTKQPSQVQPYDVWNFDFPIAPGIKQMGGVAYDPATNRVFVSVLKADTTDPYGFLPLIEVFQLTTTATPSNTPPHIGTLAATPSTLAPGPIAAGTQVTLTAGNAYAITGGISQVKFYRDANGNGTLDVGTDILLGTGSVSTIPNANHNYTLTISSSGMSSGNYTIFAQATDSSGLFSNPIKMTLAIQ